MRSTGGIKCIHTKSKHHIGCVSGLLVQADQQSLVTQTESFGRDRVSLKLSVIYAIFKVCLHQASQGGGQYVGRFGRAVLARSNSMRGGNRAQSQVPAQGGSIIRVFVVATFDVFGAARTCFERKVLIVFSFPLSFSMRRMDDDTWNKVSILYSFY